MKNMGKACGKHFWKLKESPFDLSCQRYSWNGASNIDLNSQDAMNCTINKDKGHEGQTITSLLSIQVRTTTTG